MPDKCFVYPKHQIYEPFRELAESTEIIVNYDTDSGINIDSARRYPVMLVYKQVDVPNALAYPDRDWSLRNTPEWARRPGARSHAFWNNGGLNTLSHYKQWPENYFNEGKRVLRDVHEARGVTPQANEIITWGVGALRPLHIAIRGLAAALGERAKRVDSKLSQNLGIYITDTQVHRHGQWQTAPCALASTNIVMPEVIGELNQLSARREESGFINAYLRDLLETVAPRPVPEQYGGGDPIAANLVATKFRWREAHRLHLQTGLWLQPPGDTSELLDRVDEILDRIIVDEEPIERYQAA